MVEGGARIILSFLSASERLVDSLIVTVAPVVIGGKGVGYSDLLDDVARLEHVRTEVFGKDTVMALKAAT